LIAGIAGGTRPKKHPKQLYNQAKQKKGKGRERLTRNSSFPLRFERSLREEAKRKSKPSTGKGRIPKQNTPGLQGSHPDCPCCELKVPKSQSEQNGESTEALYLPSVQFEQSLPSTKVPLGQETPGAEAPLKSKQVVAP
jgi:hypothetical protein